MEDIRNHSFEALREIVARAGHPAYRVRQLFKWLYGRGASTFDVMTDISRSFRSELAATYAINDFRLERQLVSADGTIKFLFRTPDGKLLESVLIPKDDRMTACISSQVGCAMGCVFCNTGDRGFDRDLETWEILEQLLAMRRISGREINNIVFMGMGEPLMNYDNLVTALRILLDEHGFRYSPRKITVSTAGLADRAVRLASETGVKIAVSLNATTDDVRGRLMPVNRKTPIAELLAAMRRVPLDKDGEVTFEYVLFDGVNDTPEDAVRLHKLLSGIRSKVNLICYNDWGRTGLGRPSQERVMRFQRMLWDRGMRVLLRESKGADIGAACGQLRGEYLDDTDQGDGK